MTASRRLAAILATDAAGYSRLMGADEEGKHERLKMPLKQIYAVSRRSLSILTLPVRIEERPSRGELRL